MARYFGRYVPGKPKVIVVNISRAGNLSAANKIYNMPSSDGLTVVTFHYSHVPIAIIGDPAVNFDQLKHIWMGSPRTGDPPRALFVRSDLNIRTLDDLKKSKETLTLGDTGANTGSTVAGKFLRQIGYPVRNVTGYRGSSGTMAALERKEVYGRITTQESVQSVYRRFLDEGIIRPVLSLGNDPRFKHFSGIATIKDIKLDTPRAELMTFLIRVWRHLLTYVLLHLTPRDRAKVLQEAFLQTL